MENLQIGIQNDFGGYDSFQIDVAILNGLYLTFDRDKINENCNKFNIEASESEVIKISKKDNITILSIGQSNKNQFQFLIGNDLKIKELQLLPKKIIPTEIKKIIKESFKLSQTELIDLINLSTRQEH